MLECAPIDVLYNLIASKLGDPSRYRRGIIHSPHLSPLLTAIIKQYFRGRLTDYAELRSGEVVIAGKGERLARQYVYTALVCAKRFLERGEVCSYFKGAYSLPEEKLAQLADEELMKAIEDDERKRAEVAKRAEEIAERHGRKYGSWREAYRAALELVRPNSCEERLLAREVAKRLTRTGASGNREDIKGAVLSGDYTKMPPCMRSILERILSGENVSHFERFAVAAYLLNYLGLSIDEVIGIFSKVPDFREDVTRYQL